MTDPNNSDRLANAFRKLVASATGNPQDGYSITLHMKAIPDEVQIFDGKGNYIGGSFVNVEGETEARLLELSVLAVERIEPQGLGVELPERNFYGSDE